MKQQSSFSFSVLPSLFFIVFLLPCSKTRAQSPAASPAGGPAAASPPPPVISQSPAASPAQRASGPAPTNVTKILEKSGHFAIFIRLLRSTEEEGHLLTVLNNSNNGLTIFAPSDGAFSTLKSGTLNSLTDQEKSELVKFHVIPSFLSSSQFQTVTNPVGTEAGAGGRVALNFTTYPNSVNITTGLTNTSISSTVYSDNQLAIYRVDKVLLPLDIFTAKSPSPAPLPATEKKPKKKTPATDISPVSTATSSSSSSTATENTSGAVNSVNYQMGIIGFSLIFAAAFCSWQR